jgi:hypothetical protein
MRKTVAAFCVAAVAALAPLSMSGEETVGPYVLIPDRVFDGESLHEGWVVVVEGQRIADKGIVVDNAASGVTIGGLSPQAQNLISGNGTGIDVFGFEVTIQGNLIGVNASINSRIANAV